METKSANGPTHAEAVEGNELRQRLPQQPDVPRRAVSEGTAKEVVVELNTAEDTSDKQEKDKKTYGRTFDGIVFTVPQTHDMVSQLLSPTQPKNLSDLVVIVILGLHVAALALLPYSVSVPLFAVVYIFWRTAYNGGIGYLLYEQSKYNSIINWAKRSSIFEDPSTGKNSRPRLYALLKREMETKIPKDYKFDQAPLEYNTWLLFRRVVDLILMCDFVSYCCFAIACGGRPLGENIILTIARWALGIFLVLFNLWVKLDAHRVVKDFAWYWGDFFFLIDQELTFDGVFAMAPHPMYSIGYAGYYGITLMAASYKVLFISIFAHAAQFAFLVFIETPHMDKIYNPPPPRSQLAAENEEDNEIMSPTLAKYDDENWTPATTGGSQTYVRDIIGLSNIDLHRVVDVATILIQIYIWTFAIFTPLTPLYQSLFVVNAGLWRLWYSIGIGYILDRQSKKKKWTRHFIKYGENTREAWRQWKGIYHLSMTICYTSFAAASYKMYSLPPDWEYGTSLLRHVIGLALIALQIWTVFSIYESLGEFGWFYGDFFFNRGSKLTYSGIYRFLNNPERVMGLAGVWGLAVITWSKAVFCLAGLSHGLTLCFIQFVERPHMQQRYGRSLRQRSGLSTGIKNSLPGPLQKWQDSVDRAIEETADLVEDFIESARPRVTAGVDAIVKDTKAAFRNSPAPLSIGRHHAAKINGLSPLDYSIDIENASSPEQAPSAKISGREGDLARVPSFRGWQFQPLVIQYGAPIRLKWSAPLEHSPGDWIGLYMIADNASRAVTRVSSQGRWIATSAGFFDSARAEQGQLVADRQTIRWNDAGQGQPLMTGEMEFASDKLWWTTGVFEFRYHHNARHDVMALSKPFEIRISRFDEDNGDGDGGAVQLDGAVVAGGGSPLRLAVEQALLPVVRNCFDRDPEIAPQNAEEAFGALVEREGKFAKRVVFAVMHMFGIELAPSVVKADGNVKNLAWRVCNAKQVLAPYSMSSSKGRSTPTEVND